MARSGEELVPRLAQDPNALEAFYRAHVALVTRFATRRCRCPEDVADVVSATFVSAISGSRRFDPEKGRAAAWLLGIAAHEASTLHRLSARDEDLHRRVAGRRLLDESDYERLEAQIEAERLAPGVVAALSEAPEGERELFFLVSQAELTAGEAARVLGISAV